MYNWAKSIKIADKEQIKAPKDIHELQSIIKSLKPNQKIKAVGSRMSFLGIAQTANEDDIMLDMSHLSSLVEIRSDVATFESGATMQSVADRLIQHNLQIKSCPGVLMTQTIAGALATGTHGQGLANAGLYDAVVSIQAISGDGSIQDYHLDENDDIENPLHAFQCHLGCLGIITKVTFACEPLQIYKVSKVVTDFQALKSNFLKWNEEACHAKAWWFPNSDHVQLWQTQVATKDQCQMYKDRQCQTFQLSERDHSLDSGTDVHSPTRNKDAPTMKFSESIEEIVKIMEKDTFESATESVEEAKARFRTVTRFKSLGDFVGNMYQLWCKGIPAPQVNCELAIPMDKLSEALDRLHEYYNTKEEDEMHYPFILRATGSSKCWLSPAHNGPVCYIGFLVYLSDAKGDDVDYAVNNDRLQFLKDVEKILASIPGCLPHYGKFFTPGLYPFAKELPQWDRFLTLRKKLDPKDIFMNDYLADLLSSE